MTVASVNRLNPQPLPPDARLLVLGVATPAYASPTPWPVKAMR